MLFRDGYRGEFPRRSITEKEIQLAKEKDEQKNSNEEKVNSSKYRMKSEFRIDDKVFIRKS